MADPRPPRTTEETHLSDSLPYTGSDDEGGAGPERGATTGTPPWGTILGVTLVIGLLVLIVALHLTGVMGPGLHGGGH
jgi:hypothetical protein